MLEIWGYEARRLFRDRLVGQDGANKFDNILMNVVRGDWSANIFDELDSKKLVILLLLMRSDVGVTGRGEEGVPAQ